MNSEPNNVSAPVVVGMDLSEYYLNVEWDILRVPAERRVKKYPCCPEPYPGKMIYSHTYVWYDKYIENILHLITITKIGPNKCYDYDVP
jgi:hypothetical protein